MIIFSCKEKNAIPSHIIHPEKMEMIIWDVMKQDALVYYLNKKDSLRADSLTTVDVRSAIFSHHQVSDQEFHDSYVFYTKHPDLLGAMLDSMIVHQNKEAEEIRYKERKNVVNQTRKKSIPTINNNVTSKDE